jgi:hypothetical protein
VVVERRRHLVGRLERQGGVAPAAAQFVEGRVAGDAEDPRPRGAAPRIELAVLAVGPLEGAGDHVLGGGRVAQHRRDVGVDIVATVAVEHLEVDRGRPAGAGTAGEAGEGGEGLAHVSDTSLPDDPSRRKCAHASPCGCGASARAVAG